MTVDTVLDRSTWLARQQAHHDRVDVTLAGHLERARRAIAHPVEDFLFTYYRIRPAVLRRWHPGLGVTLEGPVDELDDRRHHRPSPSGVTLDLAPFVRRRDGITWVIRMLTATAERAPAYGCFGRHEWAMVHGRDHDQIRHPGLPLRLPRAEIDQVVEDGVRCTHFDAYRFFTESARPHNLLDLTPADRIDHDQPGCLHVGMDLYKIAGQLGPAVRAELIMDCFDLARDIRRVDMRASPYDVTGLGLDPIMIETAAGRAAYVAAQRELTARAQPLRSALLAVAVDLDDHLGAHEGEG